MCDDTRVSLAEASKMLRRQIDETDVRKTGIGIAMMLCQGGPNAKPSGPWPHILRSDVAKLR
jgi:hypothetical protein